MCQDPSPSPTDNLPQNNKPQSGFGDLMNKQPEPKKQENPPVDTMNCSLKVIDDYLRGTPLDGLGTIFIVKGREQDVDPRFIVGISSAESSLGRNHKGKYNAWNEFKVGTSTPIDFDSWEEAIGFVSQHIGKYYLPKGQTTIPSFVNNMDTSTGTCVSHCYCGSGCAHWVENVSKT
jgi:hypothetical protein